MKIRVIKRPVNIHRMNRQVGDVCDVEAWLGNQLLRARRVELVETSTVGPPERAARTEAPKPRATKTSSKRK